MTRDRKRKDLNAQVEALMHGMDLSLYKQPAANRTWIYGKRTKRIKKQLGF